MPANAVLYYRDINSTKANPAFDTLDKLIAAKPAQVLEFDDTANLLTNVSEEEQNNTSDDPHYDPGTVDPVIEKQYNGSFGRVLTLSIQSDVDQTIFRQKLRSFIELVQIEVEHHEFGIFGFFHPVLADFNVDPTDKFGYTLDRPIKGYASGAESVSITLRMTLGGNLKLAGP